MRILVGVDFSRFSEAALEEVARRPWPEGTEFLLVTVVEPLDLAASQTFVPEFTETKTEAARVGIERMASGLAERGWPVSSKVIPGHPRSALSAVAARWRADLVVVGSRGLGPFRRLLLGSVAAAVVRRAGCSVEIVRQAPWRRRRPGMRLLLATDGSPFSLEAARSVARRPWPAGTRIRVVSVAQPVRPLANPWVIPSREQARLDKVPPPDCWIKAICFNDSKIASRLSSTGRTKQAQNWPVRLPAFISVGEFGRNSREQRSSKNLSRHWSGIWAPAKRRSAAATASATRQKSAPAVSAIRPFESRLK